MRLCPHAALRFTTEWVSDAGLGAADDATRAAAINEIQRRQLGRIGRLQAGAWYVEECGLAHALGVGLRAGGVDTSMLFQKDESAGLLRRVLLRSYQTAGGEGIIPSRLLAHARGSAADPDVSLSVTVDSARMGVSARGQRRAVEEVGVSALQADYKEGYVLYSHVGQPTKKRHVSAEDMTNLLAYNQSLYHMDNDPNTLMRLQRVRHRLGQLVNRYLN